MHKIYSLWLSGGVREPLFFFISLASLFFYGNKQKTFLENAIFIAHTREVYGENFTRAD